MDGAQRHFDEGAVGEESQGASHKATDGKPPQILAGAVPEEGGPSRSAKRVAPREAAAALICAPVSGTRLGGWVPALPQRPFLALAAALPRLRWARNGRYNGAR